MSNKYLTSKNLKYALWVSLFMGVQTGIIAGTIETKNSAYITSSIAYFITAGLIFIWIKHLKSKEQQEGNDKNE